VRARYGRSGLYDAAVTRDGDHRRVPRPQPGVAQPPAGRLKIGECESRLLIGQCSLLGVVARSIPVSLWLIGGLAR
jgi:hypothetical protein